MARVTKRSSPPSRSPEAREAELISLAYDAVERRIREDRATSQELVHFLKLGTIREIKEREILDLKQKLMVAQTENLEAGKISAELSAKAIEAFRSYNGMDEDYEDIF